jgi:hypothetical protein
VKESELLGDQVLWIDNRDGSDQALVISFGDRICPSISQLSTARHVWFRGGTEFLVWLVWQDDRRLVQTEVLDAKMVRFYS